MIEIVYAQHTSSAGSPVSTYRLDAYQVDWQKVVGMTLADAKEELSEFDDLDVIEIV